MFSLKGNMIRGAEDPPLVCKDRQYDEELDDISSLISDACRFMSVRGGYEFSLTSHVVRHIALDVGTDLAIVLEQIPQLLTWLRQETSEQFTLLLYEQGVNLRIELTKTGNAIRLRFSELTSGHELGVDIASAHAIETGARAVSDYFIEFVRSRCNPIFTHPWFQEWLSSQQRSQSLDG